MEFIHHVVDPVVVVKVEVQILTHGHGVIERPGELAITVRAVAIPARDAGDGPVVLQHCHVGAYLLNLSEGAHTAGVSRFLIGAAFLFLLGVRHGGIGFLLSLVDSAGLFV